MKTILCAIALLLFGFSTPVSAHDDTGYEPMEVFANLAGHTLRGEGVGPDGKPVVDLAKWEFILGGRALQSTHRLEDETYGGRTIFFFDEKAKTYIFHYFTNAGFHTTGTAIPTDKGFKTIEKVIGHDLIVEVQSETFFDGDNVRVVSQIMDKDGNLSDPDQGFLYKPVEHIDSLFAEGGHSK